MRSPNAPLWLAHRPIGGVIACLREAASAKTGDHALQNCCKTKAQLCKDISGGRMKIVRYQEGVNIKWGVIEENDGSRDGGRPF